MLNKSTQLLLKNHHFIELGLGSSFSYLTYLSTQSALSISNFPLQISLAIGALTCATIGINSFSALVSKKTIFQPIIKKLFDNYEKNLNQFIDETYYKDLPKPETHEEHLERVVVKDFMLFVNSFEANGLVNKKFMNVDEYYQFKDKLNVVFKDIKQTQFLKNTFINASHSHSFSTEFGIETMFNKDNVEPFIIAFDLMQGILPQQLNQELSKLLNSKELEIKNPEMVKFLSQEKIFSQFDFDLQKAMLTQLTVFQLKPEKINKLEQIHQENEKNTIKEINFEDVLLVKSVEKNIQSLYGNNEEAKNLCNLLDNTYHLREELMSFFKEFNLEKDVSYLNIKMFLENTLDNTLLHMNRELNLLQKMHKLKSNRFEEKKEVIFKSMCDRIKKLNEKLNNVSQEISNNIEAQLDNTHEVNKKTMQLRGI
jgi:hypothetical protein